MYCLCPQDLTMAQPSKSKCHKKDNLSILGLDNPSKASKRKRETSSCQVPQKGCPWMLLDGKRYSSGIDGYQLLNLGVRKI